MIVTDLKELSIAEEVAVSRKVSVHPECSYDSHICP
jgi:hypothetical protein